MPVGHQIPFLSAGKNDAAAHLCFKERLEMTDIVKDVTPQDMTSPGKVKALTVGSICQGFV